MKKTTLAKKTLEEFKGITNNNAQQNMFGNWFNQNSDDEEENENDDEEDNEKEIKVKDQK